MYFGAFLMWMCMKNQRKQRTGNPGRLCWLLQRRAAQHGASFHGNSKHQWLPSVWKKQLSAEFTRAHR